MAKADERARLRDEVRGSAEREAMEIVTAARRDIRKIVMEARRDLFVLSAQVQAALGEGLPAIPQLGPPALAHDEERGVEDDLSAFAHEEWGVAPSSTVAAVIDEARADIAVLDRDARAVPTGSRAAVDILTPAAGERQEASPVASPFPAAAASSLLASSGDAELVQQGGASRRVLIAIFALIGFAVVLGATWMFRTSGGDVADPPAVADVAVTPPSTSAPPESNAAAGQTAAAPAPVAGTDAQPASVTLSLQTIRPAWVRAIVDGRADGGQMLRANETYEFSGRTIDLRVGDAGAVLLSVNGGEPAPLGGDGQVVDRMFGMD